MASVQGVVLELSHRPEGPGGGGGGVGEVVRGCPGGV